MREFHTDKEALDFLSERIAAEASREGVQLTEVERKMLYFSETDWTLPEVVAVNAEFEREYDDDEFEQKIAGLIRKIEAEGHSGNEIERGDWNGAVKKLSDGDHYIQVMLDSSFKPLGHAARPPHDRLKLWLTAFAVVFGIFGLAALLNWLFGPKFWAFEDWVSDHGGGKLYVTLGVLLLWYLSHLFGDRLKTIFRRKSGRNQASKV